MTDRALPKDWRLSASVASGQTSGGPIYRPIERVASEYPIARHLLDFGAGAGELARQMLKQKSIR